MVSGQTPNFEFAGQFGAKNNDYGIDIITDSIGNVYLLGVFTDSIDLDNSVGIDMHYSNGNTDVFLVKYSQTGNFLWGFTIGGSGNDVAKSIVITPQNEIFILGNFENAMDINPSSGTTILNGGGLFTAQYDNLGNLIRGWNISSSFCVGRQIIFDNSNHYYIIGHFMGTADFDPTPTILQKTSLNGQDLFISKYSYINDSCLWVSIFSIDNIDNMNSIAKDDVGCVYVSGFSYSTGFILKTDSMGNIIWQNNFNSIWAGKTDPIALKYNNGLLFVSGNFEGEVDFDPGAGTFSMVANGSRDIFLCKLDTNGSLMDAIMFGGGSFDRPEKMTLDSDINVYLTGTFLGTVDFDPGINVQNLNAVGNDIFVAKFEPDLSLRWAFNIASAGTYNSGNSLWVEDTLVWVTGYFYYNNDFDPGANTQMMTTIGLNNNDAFLAKYSMCGRTHTFQQGSICFGDSIFLSGNWQHDSGIYVDTVILGDCIEITTSILTVYTVDTSVTQNGNILTANCPSAKYQWIDCDNGYAHIPGDTSQIFLPAHNGNYAVIVIKDGCIDTSTCISYTLVGLDESIYSGTVSVYPNPNKGYITVGQNANETIIKLYSMTGQMVIERVYNNCNYCSIDISEILNGLYILEINQNDTISRIKLIKN